MAHAPGFWCLLVGRPLLRLSGSVFAYTYKMLASAALPLAPPTAERAAHVVAEPCGSLQSAGAGGPRPHPLLLPWQPSSRRQEAPTAGTVAQPSRARTLPRPPAGPLLPPPQAPVAGRPGGCRPHPGRAGAAARRGPSPPDSRGAGASVYIERRCEKKNTHTQPFRPHIAEAKERCLRLFVCTA